MWIPTFRVPNEQETGRQASPPRARSPSSSPLPAPSFPFRSATVRRLGAVRPRVRPLRAYNYYLGSRAICFVPPSLACLVIWNETRADDWEFSDSPLEKLGARRQDRNVLLFIFTFNYAKNHTTNDLVILNGISLIISHIKFYWHDVKWERLMWGSFTPTKIYWHNYLIFTLVNCK
jgi:hypothetical protein